MDNFNERLRKLRTTKGLSQHELSNRIGMNRATYARYETGDNRPDSDTLVSLADFFDVTVDFLLTGKNDNQGGSNQESKKNSKAWFRTDPDGLTEVETETLKREMEDFYKWRKELLLKKRKNESKE